jgi:hypothetical protein
LSGLRDSSHPDCWKSFLFFARRLGRTQTGTQEFSCKIPSAGTDDFTVVIDWERNSSGGPQTMRREAVSRLFTLDAELGFALGLWRSDGVC